MHDTSLHGFIRDFVSGFNSKKNLNFTAYCYVSSDILTALTSALQR